MGAGRWRSDGAREFRDRSCLSGGWGRCLLGRVRENVGGGGEAATAFAASVFAVGGAAGAAARRFVGKADVSGRLAAGDAAGDFAVVEPALVERVRGDVGRAAHLVVEVQLLHEAGVGLGHGA